MKLLKLLEKRIIFPVIRLCVFAPILRHFSLGITRESTHSETPRTHFWGRAAVTSGALGTEEAESGHTAGSVVRERLTTTRSNTPPRTSPPPQRTNNTRASFLAGGRFYFITRLRKIRGPRGIFFQWVLLPRRAGIKGKLNFYETVLDAWEREGHLHLATVAQALKYFID